MVPVWMRLPPITIGISTCSVSIAAMRCFSDTRSGELGAYERTGSLTADGTRRVPSNAAKDIRILREVREGGPTEPLAGQA